MRTFPAILVLLCLCVPMAAWSQVNDELITQASHNDTERAEQADPLNSPVWHYLRARFLGESPYQFDDRVVVSVPPFAEDPTQVPLLVDVSAIDEPLLRLVVWADLNPIQHIYSVESADRHLPRIAIRFKVQQATPVRAAVLTESGKWLVGGQYLEAAGGGYKVKIIHPMDTGLVSGIPEFYIQQLEVRRPEQAAILSMELSQPVSENPVFTFDMNSASATAQDRYTLWMRDNNGNVFEQAL